MPQSMKHLFIYLRLKSGDKLQLISWVHLEDWSDWIEDCYGFWSQCNLSHASKNRLYSTCSIPILYGDEAWTLTAADRVKLKALHMHNPWNPQLEWLHHQWQLTRLHNLLGCMTSEMLHVRDGYGYLVTMPLCHSLFLPRQWHLYVAWQGLVFSQDWSGLAMSLWLASHYMGPSDGWRLGEQRWYRLKRFTQLTNKHHQWRNHSQLVTKQHLQTSPLSVPVNC